MATGNEKFRFVSEKITQGVVLVQLDARRPGVKVPGFLKDDPMLRLNFNHLKGKGDLVVNAWGIRETLSFKGSWFPVSIPWSAVYIAHLHTDEPKVFAEDMPEEMINRAMEQMQRVGASLEELEEKRPRPVWKTRPPEAAPKPEAVSASDGPSASEAPAPAAQAEPMPETASVGARRGHLRLVK
jgi:stringent starvation protein B